MPGSKKPVNKITRPDGMPVSIPRRNRDNARTRRMKKIRKKKKIRIFMRIALAVVIIANIIIWSLILF